MGKGQFRIIKGERQYVISNTLYITTWDWRSVESAIPSEKTMGKGQYRISSTFCTNACNRKKQYRISSTLCLNTYLGTGAVPCEPTPALGEGQ